MSPSPIEERPPEEVRGLLLILRAALEADRDAGIEVRGWAARPAPPRCTGSICRPFSRSAWTSIVRRVSVRMIVRRRLAGLACHEGANGHVAGPGRDAQVRELVEAALVRGEAHADVDLLVRIVGPVGADLDAVGHQLDDAADEADTSAPKRGRLRAVHLQPPLDAGQRPRVLGVEHAGLLRDDLADLVDGVLAAHPGTVDDASMMMGLPCSGPSLRRARLDHEAGDVGGARVGSPP